MEEIRSVDGLFMLIPVLIPVFTSNSQHSIVTYITFNWFRVSYSSTVSTFTAGSVDDTDAHDKLVLGPGLKDAIGEIPEDKGDKEDKDLLSPLGRYISSGENDWVHGSGVRVTSSHPCSM